MGFKEYQHIERYGNDEVLNINQGICYIFPKIDGTNSSVWMERGELFGGSRSRQLSRGEGDNQGFYEWVLKQDNFKEFFAANKDCIVYGEWLVPHTLRTYRNDAWKKLYVFDIFNISSGAYISYEAYKEILEHYNIEYIPCQTIIKNGTYEQFVNELDKNIYLIKDGEGNGEGIVIKNYEYKNKYGRQIWAKIVRNEYKEQFYKAQPLTILKGRKQIENEIVNKFVSEDIINKEYAKIKNEVGWNSDKIPRLLNTVYYSLIKEELWNILKKFKNPIIDFQILRFLTIKKIKEIRNDLFLIVEK